MTGNTHQGSPYDLENLSIPELEALLQQDFIASDDSVTDEEYIMAIMEVIQKKEESQPDYQKINIEEAWEEFQNFYNSNEGKEYSLYRSEESADEDPVSQVSPKRRKYCRPCLIALLILLLVAIASIPVVGHMNVIQMVMSKAYSTFRFTPKIPDSNSESVDSLVGSYDTIQDALEACNITVPVVPKILLDDFEQTEIKLLKHLESQDLELFAYFKNGNQNILLRIIILNSFVNEGYEGNVKDKAELYTTNKVDHVIFSNIDDIFVVWHNDNLECSLTGNIDSVDEAKILVESIYQRK